MRKSDIRPRIAVRIIINKSKDSIKCFKVKFILWPLCLIKIKFNQRIFLSYRHL